MVDSDRLYKKLDAAYEVQEIRLLQVHKNSLGQLECTLRTFSLWACSDLRAYYHRSAPPDGFSGRPFVAVSYTWGPEHPQHTISVNGRPFKIRENLRDVLDVLASSDKRCHRVHDNPHLWCCVSNTRDNYIRPTHEEFMKFYFSQPDLLPACGKGESGPWWWIDAICIDQDNVIERNEQVSMMPEIYQKANIVLSWLGQESCHQELIAHILERTPSATDGDGAMFGYARDLKRWAEAYAGGLAMGFAKESGMYADEFLASKTVTANARLIALLSRSYWTRAWIVQECLLAPHLIFCIGNNLMPWHYLAHAAFSTRGNDATPGFRLLFEKARYRRHDPKTMLIPTLMTWRFQHCQNPCDAVYAMLGIMSGENQVRVDYRQSCEEVFVQVIASTRLNFILEDYFTWYQMGSGDLRPVVSEGTFNNSADFLQFCAVLCKMLHLNPSNSRVVAAATEGVIRGRRAHFEFHSSLQSYRDEDDFWSPAYGLGGDLSYLKEHKPETAIGQRMIRERLKGVTSWTCHPLDWHGDSAVSRPNVVKEDAVYHMFEHRRPGDESI